MQWIKENIISFQGNASEVTLMGHGSGAVSAQFLMSSKMLPKGIFLKEKPDLEFICNIVVSGMLFKRVALMSGFATSLNAFGKSTETWSKHMIEVKKSENTITQKLQ